MCLDGSLQRSGAEAGVETLARQVINQFLSPHKLDTAFLQTFSRCEAVLFLLDNPAHTRAVQRTESQNRVDAVVKLRPKKCLRRAVVRRV